MTLQDFFTAHPKVALGFSGGVDSAYLLYVAKKYGAEIQPYFIQTAFQPAFELEDAQRLCRELEIPLKIINHDILQDQNITKNPKNRCYFCKKTLFSLLKQQALADGYSVLLDGNNASDDATDRPGMQAARELAVCSPLRDCGLTKGEIRTRSKEAGLFTWDKPAYACLATRFPTGVALEAATLQQVEAGELALMKLGFSDFRLRYFFGAARLQFPQAQMPRALELRREITTALSPAFDPILLDFAGR